MAYTLIEIKTASDIPEKYQGTPVGDLLRYHNLKRPFRTYEKAKMLIVMCMDNRKQLSIPNNFAYIIRTGGANLARNEFKLSYAVAIGAIRHVALIAHDRCGMVGLTSKKDAFIEGMCRLPNWDKKRAEEYFLQYAPVFEIDNETDFVVKESKRLSETYMGVTFVPLYYTIDDGMLKIIEAG